MKQSADILIQNILREISIRQWPRGHIADLLDIYPAQLTNYLNGKNKPGLEMLDRFAKIFETTPDALLRENAPQKAPTKHDLQFNIELRDALIEGQKKEEELADLKTVLRDIGIDADLLLKKYYKRLRDSKQSAGLKTKETHRKGPSRT